MSMMKRDNALPPAARTATVAASLVDQASPLSTPPVLRYSLRRLWLRLHVYIGLFGGALFVFMGLTGSCLVFYKAIDAWLHPAQLTTAGTGSYRLLHEIVASAQSGGSPGGWLDSLEFPLHEHDVFQAWHKMPIGETGKFRWYQVAIDPYTGAVLSRDREWGGHLVSLIYQLHASLLMDEFGGTIVGGIGLLLLFSIVTGLYLWWPQPGRLRQAFTFQSKESVIRRHYQWHKLSGLYGAIVLAMLAGTGVYLEFGEYVVPIVRLFSPVKEFTEEVRSVPMSGVPSMSVEQVVSQARHIFPEGELRSVGFPHDETGVYQLTFRQPGEVRQSGGESEVWLDQYSGDVRRVVNWQRFTGGETFLAWLFPLHNGEAFGLIGRWIVFACGFVPLILYVTALRMWWLKRAAHRRQHRQAIA